MRIPVWLRCAVLAFGLGLALSIQATPSAKKLFIAKSDQRLLGLRTQLIDAESAVSRLRVVAEVVSAPEFESRIVAPKPGRIELATPWHAPGQTVRRGDVLAWLVPTRTLREDSQRRTEIALLKQKRAVARVNAERLAVQADAHGDRRSPNNVYYEQAQLELALIESQLAAAQEAFGQRTPLQASDNGALRSVLIQTGDVVAAGHPLFELVQTDRFWVSATLFDPDARLATTAEVDGVTLQRQALGPADNGLGWTSLWSGPVSVSQHEPGALIELTVTAQRRDPSLRQACIVEADGSGSIWLHTGAETFQSRGTESCESAAQTAQAGERWVTRGAVLLAQHP